MKNRYKLKKQIELEIANRRKIEMKLSKVEVELHKMRASLRWKIGNYPYKIYKTKIKMYLPRHFFLAINILIAVLKKIAFVIKESVYSFHRLYKKHIPQKLYFTIGIASYNHSEYLEQCIQSCLAQDYKYFDIVIVDDYSSDPKNKEILKKYETNSRIKIILKDNNEGISASLNDQVIHSKVNWIAFIDCDDYLPKNALSSMALYIEMHPEKKLVVSNRIEIDESAKFLQKVNFQKRFHEKDIFKMLLDGMVSSHLKVIHKDVFRKIGLFDQRFGGTHDYDMFLRVAFYMPKAFGFINKYLYYHRIHSNQNTLIESNKHNQNISKIKKEALFRKKVYHEDFSKKVSIIILSFERGERTKKTVNKILKNKDGINKEIIIWDNFSQDSKTISILKELEKKDGVQVVFNKKNLHCSGGRLEASKLAIGDYILFLDNDVEIFSKTIKELIIRLNESPKYVGVCCKVIFPDDTIQYNGGMMRKKEGLVTFELIDSGRKRSDVIVEKKVECDWIPGGATMFKREIFKHIEHDIKYINAYEDNDFSMLITNKLNKKVVNCPTAEVIHHHINYESIKDKGTRKYTLTRYNKYAFVTSWVHFYKKWGLIIDDLFVLDLAQLKGASEKDIKNFLNNASDI